MSIIRAKETEAKQIDHVRSPHGQSKVQSHHPSNILMVFRWAVQPRIIPIILRGTVVTGIIWGIVQFVDRFVPGLFPVGAIGIILVALIIICIFLCVQLAIPLISPPADVCKNELREAEEKVFAKSLVEFARSLARQHRDQTLIELRNSSNRVLHLIGAISERQDLGRLALEAAAVAQDRLTQAAILIDDLGWSVYEAGDIATATHNIKESIVLLDKEIETSSSSRHSQAIELKLKALRHLAIITAGSRQHLQAARQLFAEPRRLSSRLESKSQALNLAQLDYSEALVIFRAIEIDVGPATQIDSTTENGRLLTEAAALAESAERSFQSLGDIEREVKALKLRVDILAHDTRQHPHREAKVRLQRIEANAARSFQRTVI